MTDDILKAISALSDYDDRDQQIAILTATCARQKAELEMARARELHLIDAARLFAERCKAKPEEIAQLGIGTLIPGDKASGRPAAIEWNTLDDLKTASDFAMKQQATAAKFRNLKASFVRYQDAVSAVLAKLDVIGAKNRITKHDVHDVLFVRDTLRNLIGRSL